eukprot:scaffold824_cov64-Phaeocystis_antarctica.AAC.6
MSQCRPMASMMCKAVVLVGGGAASRRWSLGLGRLGRFLFLPHCTAASGCRSRSSRMRARGPPPLPNLTPATHCSARRAATEHHLIVAVVGDV